MKMNLLTGNLDFTELAKPVVKTGCDLIMALFGKPFQIAGDLLADEVYAWQWSNRLRIAAKAKSKLEQSDVDSRVLPKGFLLPLLDAAGNAEEESLQDLWATLLANAVADDQAQQRMFIETLKSLSSRDAKVFVSFARSSWSRTRRTRRFTGSNHPSDMSVARLVALGLIAHDTNPEYKLQDKSQRIHDMQTFRTELKQESRESVSLTDYGRAFYRHVCHSADQTVSRVP